MIDVERLTSWLDVEGLPGKGEPAEVAYVSGGSQNEIYEVRRGDFHAALRIPPAAAPDGRDGGILREWRLIEALDDTDVPCTPAIRMCADRAVLGRSFYLMGFVDGWSPMGLEVTADGQRPWPAPFDTDVAARQGLAYELVEGIALLSKVDWKAKGLADLGRPDGFHERQVERWTAFLERIPRGPGSKGRELPGFDEASAWLRAHRPIDFVPGLMHGDYQFANVMYRHGGPARLAAIVDWEMGTVGDPKLDLAWVVSSWPEDTNGEGAALSYVDMTGMPSRDAVLAHYAEVSGRQVDDIDYYNVLARWKLAVVLEQGFQRAGDDEKLQAFGAVVLDLMRSAADLAETTDYAVAANPGSFEMLAAVCRAYGPPEGVTVEELPAPTIGPGQVRVAVTAAAVNFPDVLIVAGEYQIKAPTPFVPGSELAGVVTEVAPDVHGGSGGVAVGDRVTGTVLVGAFAEEVVVPASSVRPVPDGVALRVAAALGVAHRTANHVLRSVARLQQGEVLVVLGAGGGVGLATVQLGALMGAEVVAVASSADKLAAASAAGATHLVDHRAGDLRAALRALLADRGKGTGGADVVVDPVGGDLAEPALRSLRWGGRFVTVGYASGVIPAIPLNLVLLKGVQVLGFEFLGFATNAADELRRNDDELDRLLASGAVVPHIGAAFPLAEAAAALAVVGRGEAIGKVVIDVAPESAPDPGTQA